MVELFVVRVDGRTFLYDPSEVQTEVIAVGDRDGCGKQEISYVETPAGRADVGKRWVPETTKVGKKTRSVANRNV